MIPNWVYDVAGHGWVKADRGSFSCDRASGYYLSPKYYYDKRSGWYKIVPASEPAPEGMITAPNVVHTQLGDLTVGSQDYQLASRLGLLEGQNSILVSGAGRDSTNPASVSNTGQTGNNGQTWVDLTNLVNVINTLQSTATSGNVAASSNTNVGNASTGAVSVVANLINLLVSAWSWSHGNLNFFTRTLCELNQTCTGDITLAPTESEAGSGGSLGAGAAGADSSSSLDVNARSEGNITNNVDLSARSGDANATRNTTAGNISTGSATAEVNILNLINSFISSGSSFFGILNIFGSLNGDILFPEGFLNGLVPSGTNNQSAGHSDGETNINNASSGSVSNNITMNAASGSVGASANTNVGNVSTGAASTTQGLFNLANSSIFGDNAVLVIVNVLGHWVGKIMTIPGGSGTTSSALLTGNAQVGTNGTGSSSQVPVNNSARADINQQSVGTITNNVNVNAQSGNAEAYKNTNVGDVTTGAAEAVSSVANIFNSVLNVSHWFGVLVINVFGDWNGHVNENTTAGNTAVESVVAPAVAAAVAPRLGLSAAFSGPASVASSVKVVNVDSDAQMTPGRVLTAAAEQPASSKVAAAVKDKGMSILFAISAVVMLLAGALASLDRKLKNR